MLFVSDLTGLCSNEHTDKISFGCEGEESCVTSQQASDCFLFDSKITVGISFDHYKLGDYETH